MSAGYGPVQLSDGNPDGSIIGADATKKIGFYGKTPIAQRASAAQAAVATTGATSTGPFGFTEAQANGIVALLNEVSATLTALGLWKGAA